MDFEKKVPRLDLILLSSSISRERNVWTSTEKTSPQTSPSPAAPARSRTGPNTAACAPTSAAASPTSPKPSTWSLSVLMGRGSPGRWCGCRPASATSAAKTPTTSSQNWRVTTATQKSWTNRWPSRSQPQSFFWLLFLIQGSVFVTCMIMYKFSYGLFSYWKNL